MRDRMVGAADISLAVVVGMLAVTMAIGATVASAAPTWHYCATTTPKNTGNYANSTCSEASEPGKGKFELFEGIGKGTPFKLKGGEVTWHTVIPGKGDFSVTCKSFSGEGHVAVPNKVTGVVLKLSKCTVLGSPCTSEGALKETIVTEVLAGEIGYLNKVGAIVGLDLANEAAPGSGLVANFNCEGFVGFRWFGSFIGEQSGDVNVISKEFKLSYSVGPLLGELEPGYTPLVNTPSFEGGTPDYLLEQALNESTGKWEPEAGLPTGVEAAASGKGEALMLKA